MSTYDLIVEAAEILVFFYALRETMGGIAHLKRIIRHNRERLTFARAIWYVAMLLVLIGPSLHFGLPVGIELQKLVVSRLTA